MGVEPDGDICSSFGLIMDVAIDVRKCLLLSPLLKFLSTIPALVRSQVRLQSHFRIFQATGVQTT